MEKGDVAETEELNTATDPDEVYENRGKSAAIDKDTDKLKVSTDDQPSLITSVMSKDKEAETGYSSQGEIRFITSPVRNTPISNRPRSPTFSSRPPFYVPEQTSLELENEESTFGRCIERSGIVSTFKTLIEEVTTTMSEMKEMVRDMKGKESRKQDDRDTCTDPDYRERKLRADRKKTGSKAFHTTRLNHRREVSSDSSSDEEDDIQCSLSTPKTSRLFQDRSYSKAFGAKLPPFTGTEQRRVWYNRFESVASLNGWDDHEKLQQLLPRVQGKAAEFVFGQLKPAVTNRYPALIKEMKERFDEIQTTKTYVTQFGRRNQSYKETPEEYAAELKRLYDRAYPRRGPETRQEDLLRRFLMGLNNNSARIHVELNKEPTTIEEAVHYVVHYFEAARNPHNGSQNEDDQERSQRTRQVKSDNKSNKESSEHKKQKTEKTEIGKQKDKTVKFTDQRAEQCGNQAMVCMNKEDLEELLKGMMANLKGSLNSTSTQSRSSYNENKKVVCYTCNEPGHISRNCPQKLGIATGGRPLGAPLQPQGNPNGFNVNAREFNPTATQQLNCSGSTQ